jgi:hypothetical protein
MKWEEKSQSSVQEKKKRKEEWSVLDVSFYSFIHFSFFISFILSCLLFRMATLQEKINALEAEIEGYKQEYANAATTEARKDSLLAAITESKKTLNLLLQQQQGE